MKQNCNQMMRNILCIYMTLFPWIIFKKKLLFSEAEQSLAAASYIGVTDTVLYGKSVITVFVAIILLALGVYGWRKENRAPFFLRRKKGKILGVCMVIYMVATILSTLFSDYPSLAFWGNVNSCEGMLTLLAYPVLFVTATEVFSVEENQKYLKGVLCTLCTITVLLSLVEFFYEPVLKILWREDHFGKYTDMLVLTFYNPSYYAAFSLLLVQLCGVFFFLEEKFRYQILWGFYAVGMTFCVIASKSTAAFYLMTLEWILLLMGFGVYAKSKCVKGKEILKKIFVLVLGILILICLNFISDGKLFQVASQTSVNETREIHRESFFELKDIEITDGKVALVGKEHTLIAQLVPDEKISFVDENRKEVAVSVSDEKIIFSDSYRDITAWIESDALTFDLGYRDPIHFYIYNGEFYPMLTDGSILSNIDGNGIDAGDFVHFATGRGFFWVNSLPVLKECLLLGHGAGTFQMYFKQYDYVGLLNSQGTTEILVDKPHNYYIQTAVQSGIPAAVALIIFFIMILFSGLVKVVCKKELFLFGLVLSAGAFLVFEIFTDSCVTVNPLFWILLGILETYSVSGKPE